MLVTFFIIVFIAELIVTAKVVELILIWDKKVCTINSEISKAKLTIKKELITVRIALNNILFCINRAELKIEQERRKIQNRILKYLITTTLVFLLKNNGRLILGYFELILAMKNLVSLWLKCNNSKKNLNCS